MQTYTLKKPTPSIVSFIDWVAKDPQNAAKVAASIIIFGVAILAIAAIFSS